MNRGEVWWVGFDLSIGGEMKKERLAVIVSNDVANKHLNRVQVVPLSSNVERLYPSEALASIGSRQSKAMADQLATVSKLRLRALICRLTDAELRDVERAIRVQLALADAPA